MPPIQGHMRIRYYGWLAPGPIKCVVKGGYYSGNSYAGDKLEI